ncbi:hypothetical protein [Pseudonocardia sp. GCM10023141]|uniref:hypothetical protein n=1 Tax=Pseudonocardia sp. GCM10023141 TaxID=3252653 RepID=UPI00360CECB5
MTTSTPDQAATGLPDLAGLLASDDPNELVKAFAANPAFRAAEWDELTTGNDPYRRPVRPADLAWLDYAKPMPVEKSLKLSALLGHRMLRNVHDAGILHLPASPDAANRVDRADVYSTRNRVLAALAGPVLEAHLFAPLAEQRPELLGDVAGLRRVVEQECERRHAEPGAAFSVAAGTKHRREASTFLLLQVSAFRPAVAAAAGRGAVGEYDAAHPGLRGWLLDRYRAWADGGPAYREVLAAAGLVDTAGAYWQLYLGSSLGRGNHLLSLASRPEHGFALLGALVHEWIDDSAVRGVLRETLAGGLDGVPDEPLGASLTPTAAGALVEELVGPLAQRLGAEVVAEFHRGFVDAATSAALWDRDLSAQLDWADRIEEYQEKAETIDQHLTNENIVVDLDTFVEDNEETSTTHVHNEHRLVMIESGQMHFWNNVTHQIALNAGDKLLIPVSRLHGSTVLSGTCTYHQPIIPDELLAQFA